MGDRVILHSDINCCYASIEHLHHPELAGKPLAVGGDPEARHGIVLTADYIAKKYGVKTGMALWQAKQVCPNITFVSPRMDLYLRFSRMAHEIYAEYTDRQEPYGIDECWLDVTGSSSLKGDGLLIAQEISRRMKSELGITVSVGVSFNKIFAKLGSDYKKPDAITTMYKSEFKQKAWSLPVADLLYVGKSTNRKLALFGIKTIGDLARADEDVLNSHLGKMGSILWSFANGYDDSPVKLEKGEYFMQLKYVDTKEEIIAINRKSKHIEPHLHNALEIVCVTSGALELGVGQELYHMDKGDIGFVFPDVIHHYQVLTPGENKATYLIASPFTIAKFADIMQSMAPEYPIIKAEKVEPEVYRVINAILETEQSDITVAQAYLQIVLARCIGKLNLVEKSNVGSNDLIYQTVSYISANFKKKFSLEEMAKDLGVSKYVLSRLFSKTFHRNFNQYLNVARLNYACHRLENTRDSITNICLDSGFESQRTFNRVFKERYKISPSDYRSTCVKEMLS